MSEEQRPPRTPTQEVADDAATKAQRAAYELSDAIRIVTSGAPQGRSKRPDTRPAQFRTAEALLRAAYDLTIRAQGILNDFAEVE